MSGRNTGTISATHTAVAPSRRPRTVTGEPNGESERHSSSARSAWNGRPHLATRSLPSATSSSTYPAAANVNGAQPSPAGTSAAGTANSANIGSPASAGRRAVTATASIATATAATPVTASSASSLVVVTGGEVSLTSSNARSYLSPTECSV